MDKRLTVNDGPRPVPPGASQGAPIVTLAWRALRSQWSAHDAERRRMAEEAEVFLGALAIAAEAGYQLRRAGVTHGALGRLEQALAAVGISVVAPEGSAFTADLSHVLENVAQRYDPALTEPRVAEVIVPAIVHQEAVLRMGKAVVALPASAEQSGKG